jgi:tripartite-type tricarboxylate transporter receptor subunit TctC
MLGRAGTSNDIVTRLNGLIGKIVSTPEMKEALNRQGLEPQANSPQQLAAMVRAEFVKNANLIKAANLKSE